MTNLSTIIDNVTENVDENVIMLVEKGFLSLHFLTGLVIIALNGAFVAAVAKNETLRTLDNVLLIKLSCFDILAGVSVIVNSAANIFSPVPYRVCVLSAFLIGIAFLGSIFSLLGLTMERYVKICHPFVYLRLATSRTATIYIVVEGLLLTLFTVFTMSFAMLTAAGDEGSTSDRRCMPLRFADRSPVTLLMTYLVMALPLLVSTVVYLRLAWIAHKQRTTIRMLTVLPSSESGHRRDKLTDGCRTVTEKRRLNVVGLILFMHYVSLLPTLFNSLIVSMATISLTLAILSKALRELANAFVYLNSVMNPVIYAFRNQEIRTAILKLLKRT